MSNCTDWDRWWHLAAEFVCLGNKRSDYGRFRRNLFVMFCGSHVNGAERAFRAHLVGRPSLHVSLRLQLTRKRAMEFYAEHEGKPFFGGLVDFMTSGPVYALVLAKVNWLAGSASCRRTMLRIEMRRMPLPSA